MNVRVTHNSVDISHHVISYNREHKICTGIGMLELEVDYTYTTSFDPYDHIDVYEGGNLAGKYYVSRSEEGQPNSTHMVTAQDNSKKLVDYFISDSYLVDYPSYSKYWIELFLTEVGIPYTFTTTEPGSLLSNNTSLGLVSAYEQIIQLLQLSGWYIYFKSNGRAMIGKLDQGGIIRASVGNSDIIHISVDKHDRMYRNRVVVWGHGDPISSGWVFSDVSRPTKWDYDRRDKRTILISNSNIPSVRDAFTLANKALTEFARITVEKRITIVGTKNVQVGDMIGVRNKLFSGKGLLTTINVSMSKAELITELTLDERCPRMFAFYNPGGFVYVGTFGSGVWRKHIEPTSWSGSTAMSGYASGYINFSGWFDYSSGLMDRNITDLHVNAGVLVSVGSSGTLYYSLEDTTVELSGVVSSPVWSGIVLSGLQVTYSGELVESTVYSGLMGRACIIERDTNALRYVVDTRSGINYGDFIMETNPISSTVLPPFEYNVITDCIWYNPVYGATASGISGVQARRAWVLDANPYDGVISGIHPIQLSGNYNVYGYDIENDGTHDYVEAMILMSGSMPTELYNGIYEGAEVIDSYTFGVMPTIVDDRLNTYMAFSGYPDPILQIPEVHEEFIFSNAEQVGPAAFYDSLPTTSGYMVWAQRALTFPYTVTLRANELYYDYTDPLNPVLQGQDYSADSISNTINTVGWAVKRLDPTRRAFTYIGFEYLTAPLSNTLTPFTANMRHTEFDLETETAYPTLTVLGLFNASDSMKYSGAGLPSYKNPRYAAYRYIVTKTKLVQAKCVANVNYGFDIWVNVTSLIDGSSFGSLLVSINGTGNTQDSGEYFFHDPLPVLFPNQEDDFRLLIPYIKSTYVSQPIWPYEDQITFDVKRYTYDSSSGEGEFTTILDWSDIYGPVYVGQKIFNGNASYDTFGGILKYGNFDMRNQYCSYQLGAGTNPGGNPDFYPADSGEVITDFFTDFVVSHGVGSSPLDQYNRIYNIRGNTLISEGDVEDDARSVGRKLDDSFVFIGVKTGEPMEYILPEDDAVTLLDHLSVRDSFNGEHFYRAIYSGYNSGEACTIALDRCGVVTRFNNVANDDVAGLDLTDDIVDEKMFGNFRIIGPKASSWNRMFKYVAPAPISGIFPMYMTLQRNEDDYSVVKSGLYRDRLEISLYSPLVTLGRNINSLQTYFISMDNEVTALSNPTMSGHALTGATGSASLMSLGLLADDVRYSYFEDTPGSGTSGRIEIVYSGGVASVDLYTLGSLSGLYSNSTSILDTEVEISGIIPSGNATRIEISNFALPDQYTFLSVKDYVQASGEFGFFQKNPVSGVWVDYSSGFPQSRTTIIRLDDAI